MLDDIKELEQKIKKEAEDSLAETMWGKPANDIITGISNNSSVKPDRAIWELVQNARDVSKPEERAVVKFIRRNDEFVFEHNGQPFDRKSIQSLILQTSSKVRNDIVKVGQYGTGFLTTHKFGLRFKLQGALKVSSDENLYYNFNDDENFIIDRSSRDKLELSRAIQDQVNQEQSWGENIERLSVTPSTATRFTYIHEHDIERKNVKEAFERSPELAPYVLALNQLISKIYFIDEVDRNNSAVYSIGDKEQIFSNDSIFVDKVNVMVGSNEDMISLYTLTSRNEIDEETGESKVTVILPCLSRNNESAQFHELDASYPQLYLYLPLLGTENWGWNYIIHAPSFTCDKDLRDSLLFVGNGQNNDDQAQKNRDLIGLAGQLIREFLSSCLDKMTERKYIGRVNFLPAPQDRLKEYYEDLQREWVSYFEAQPLVKSNDTYIAVKDVKVLDKQLYSACMDDAALLDALYELFEKDAHKLVIPEKQDMIHWSRYVDEWYVGKPNSHTITLSDICGLIKKTALTAEDLTWLHKICEFLKDNPDPHIPLQSIVPNENIELVESELVKPISFNSTFKSILKVLLPTEVAKFVHPDFVDILVDSVEYDKESAKKALTAYVTELPTYYSRLKQLIQSNSYVDKAQYDFLSDEVSHSLMDLFCMLLPVDGVGFSTKIYKLLVEFYNYTPATADKLDKDCFDIRNCYTPLINDALLRFTLSDDKSDLSDWELKVVKELHAFQDAHSFLRNYMLYPDQNGVFKYSDQLKKEILMPSRLKDIYKAICDKDIYSMLVKSEYQDYFIETGLFYGKTLADEIQKPFVDSNVRSIENHPKQLLFLEIIEKFSDSKDGATWRELFPTINAYKSQLMLSVIDSPQKRESIFQIMKVQDADRLSAIAELSKFDNLEHVIELGKIALEKEIQERNDLKFKKELGLYVEDYLLKELNDILCEKNSKVSVIDEQGGQDLKVRLNGETLYYIEVKSRWQTDRSVMMTSTQHQTSYKEKHRYALCAVDMCGYDRELAKEHVYPEIDSIKDNMRFITKIGELNERMKDSVEVTSSDQVHIAGGYQVLVPQDLINQSGVGISFDGFIKFIKLTIQNHLEN